MASKAILLLFASLSLLHSAFAAVLAIDYGTDWTKASLMKPGIPFDVLLNKDSKRKIHSTVGWNRDDRLFGSDALNIATRFPQDSFPSLKHVLGTQFSSKKTWYYEQIGQAILLETERGTVALERKKAGEKWTVEELIGMQFAYVKALAEDTAGERINDVVLTVPAYFSQAERQALLDAIEIAGLRSLALLNDGTAVAVNYAMTRSFPEKEYHVIYDAGAGSIRATVASFFTPDAPATTTKVSRSIKTATKESAQIDILGYGWDTTATGNELTRRLKDKLVREFEQKHGLSLAKDGKALARVWKEAERVKGILSANTEASTTIESLSNDIDFKPKTTRAAFEDACTDLTPAYVQPIVDALERAGLTWDNITSVILTGGHSRTPMVQTAVRALAGDAKIAQNVNADEAAVLGAAFYGATLSRQFRTKKIKVQDAAVHDIQVSYEAEAKSGGKRTINTLIFPRLSKANAKKTLTLKQRKGDFTLHLAYKTAESTPEFPQDILDVEISNVTQALSNLTERGAPDPVVKVTLVLSENGLVTVHDAVAYGEVKDDSLTGKLKNLFGGGGSSSSSSSSTDTASGTETASSTGSASSAAAPAETPAETKKDAHKNVPLVWTIKPLSIPPLTPEEKIASRQKLIAVDTAEKRKRQREEARNVLEAHIYRLRDLLEQAQESQTPFFDFSTAKERDELSSLLETTTSWLHESSEEADMTTLFKKKEALQYLEDPIQGRIKEHEAIPAALADLKQALNAGRVFIENSSKASSSSDSTTNPTEGENSTETEAVPPKWTPAEVTEIEELVEETQSWFEERLEEWENKPKNADASFRARELDAKGIKLQKAVLRLVNRKAIKPKAPKKKPAPSSSSATTSETTESVPEETQAPRDEL